MSIYAYVGLPGSGKSYGVVANQIIPALKAGRTVVTNIPLHIERIRQDFPVNDDQIREFPVEKISAEPDLIEEYCKPGDLCVIDELWRLFPAGQKVNHVPEQFKSFLAEHRHRVDAQGRAMQIVFVTQDLAQIGAFARQLVEQTFVHTKLGFLGAAGSYKCEIFNKSVTGPNPPQSLKIRTVLGKYSKNVYAYYKSATLSESGSDAGDETVVDSRANIWKRPVIWFAGAFCLVALPLSVNALTSYFDPETESKGSAQAASGATGRATPHKLVPINSADSVAPPPSYRVSMVIPYPMPDAPNGYAVLDNDHGDVIWIPAEKCQRSRMQWRCEHQGQWLTMKRTSKPWPDHRPTYESVQLAVPGQTR